MRKQIQLRHVTKQESPDFWDLLQKYLGEDGGRVFAAPKNQDGSYSYPHFDLYWEESTRYPFYITDGDAVVGLIMVRKLAADLYSVAEFFHIVVEQE